MRLAATCPVICLHSQAVTRHRTVSKACGVVPCDHFLTGSRARCLSEKVSHV